MNGQILNYSKIAKDVGATIPTVQSYFQILEDTLVGFLLEPFHESVRKRQREKPKFYFFDTGVQRALAGLLRVEPAPRTFAYGAAFEHFLMTEIVRLASYAKTDYRFSYLRTKDGVEIDLIIERPGMPRALVEIKSSTRLSEADVRALRQLQPDIPRSESFCLSLDPLPRTIAGVRCVPWPMGLAELGL
jgi:predicted AAA+ superfamily ATPase